MLSKKGQIEKGLLDDMVEHMEKQNDGYYSREEILHWLNLWYKHIK